MNEQYVFICLLSCNTITPKRSTGELPVSTPNSVIGSENSPPICTVQYHAVSHNLDCFAIILCPLAITSTASVTISSTISFAVFFSLTTAAALPIKNGLPLSNVSSSISSPRVSKSCSTGMMPFAVRSLISWVRFSSQF